MSQPDDLDFHYQTLGLSADARLEDVDAAYFQLKSTCIGQGDRAQIPQLKTAREAIRKHLTAQQAAHATKNQDSSQTHTTETIEKLETLTSTLANRGFLAKIKQKEQTLHIGIQIDQTLSTSQMLARVRQSLSEIPTASYDLQPIETIYLYGLNHQQQAQWKKSFSPPTQHSQTDDTDLYSFANRYSNTLVFPGLLLIAALLNSVEPIKLLLLGVDIWIHEFGHATIAWLGGHRATPLPFGWTAVGAEKSLFVYFGVLALLGFLFWSGIKEKRRWPMGIAVTLAVVQFFITWVISADTFDMLLSFGGIGGEFYLSTLLIVSFYFPLPEY
ncbi:MAG: tripartite tricarboxylate transporter TctB family protein, partial [Cyanobacteria bacterium J06632_3]